MRIVDLSHELYTGMPNIAGLHVASWPTETFGGLRGISGGKLAMESRMMILPEHCGTHLDAPRHCDEDGLTLEHLPLERVVMPGHLLDLRHKRAGEAITVADFEAAAAKTGRKIGPGAPWSAGPAPISIGARRAGPPSARMSGPMSRNGWWSRASRFSPPT